MNLDLAGKVSVVTGGGGAICGSIASAFATEDLCVAIWDISGEAAESKAGELRKSGYRAVSVECDATKRDDVQVALEKTLSEFGTIDVLVNGAGGSRAESTTSDEVAFFDLDAGEMNKFPPVPADGHFCAGCRLGAPVLVRKRIEYLRHGMPLPVNRSPDQNGEMFHSQCGDRFHAIPPHKLAVRKGIWRAE